MAPVAGMMFIGIKGSALAIDRATGTTIWHTHLKGGDFVNVVLQGNELYAATKGRLYRLDPATGTVLWTKELPGYGLGIVSVAGSPGATAVAAEKKRRDDAAAGAAAVSASS